MIHIYCGDGKGKTTAAVGLAVRFAGTGGKAVIARFLKTDDSGEVKSLAKIPEITVIPCRKTFGFTWTMTEKEKNEAAAYYTGLLHEAEETARNRKAGLLVLDELCAAVSCGLVPVTEVLGVLDRLSGDAEIVITGRDPAPEILERSDYVTEMKKIRHPFDKGIAARKGIEY